ncbi:MAG TPA: hypothetical protein VFB96_03190 [Pirellulaceae bacterium]|nr:hypothetical protein [Pirellulaceae bacterium]
MDQASPPRRSFWRFSLRELLLLMLAIAAFLGWGRAIYQRYKPFVPTPFSSKLDLQGDIRLVRQQLGETPARWVSGGSSGRAGRDRLERDYHYGFPLQAANGDAFMEKLSQRVRDQLGAHGCTVHGSGRGSSGGMKEFHMRYVRDVVEGSIRVILIGDDSQARLLVFLDEQRPSR